MNDISKTNLSCKVREGRGVEQLTGLKGIGLQRNLAPATNHIYNSFQ
jgi:hypothetical protein